MKKCLITRPEHDDTVHYLSKWIMPCIGLAEKKGIKVFDLWRERAVKKEVESIAAKENPELLLLNGHGSETAVFGHLNQPLFEVGVNESLLKGKIVYALACASAKTLGQKSVDSGTIAYLGYSDDFIFEHDDELLSRPTEDVLAKPFLEPSCELVNALLKGHTVGEAFLKSQEVFMGGIKRLLTSEGADPQTIRLLWWDMKNQVCLGDKKAKF